MGATLPDDPEGWADRFQTRLNDRDSFERAAADFTATFRLLVTPDDTYDGDPVVVTVVVDDGAAVAAAGNDAAADYDFTLSGPYTAWRELLRGEVDAAAALTGEAFDVEGSTMRLLENREAVAELVDAAQAVDTEFAY